MQITLRLNLTQKPNKRYEDESSKSHIRDCLVTLLKQFIDLSLVRELSHYGVSGNRKLEKIKSWNDLIESVTSWSKNVYKISQNQDGRGGDRIQIQLRENELMFVLSIKLETVDSVKEEIVEQLIEATKSAYSGFKKKCILRSRSGIEIYDVDYPQPSGILLDNVWIFSKIVDFIDTRYYKKIAFNEWDTAKMLLNSSILDSINTEEFSDLIILKWISNLGDENLLAEQLQVRDKWLIKNIGLRTEESEDEYIDPYELDVLPPLTFYDSKNKTGYKAAVLSEDGTLDVDLIEQIKSWLEKGSLPNDIALNSLNLILPDRDSAISIEKFATTIGVSKVFYSDNDGDLWSPK